MASTGHEDARNMALLFFMDHLMTKNGSRTIHDLSCQFGSRGFSQEMRDAVGGTQEALCEFLASYPSLFKLEGDTVSINMYGDLAHGGAKTSPLLASLTSKDRDYEKEAVAFFETKLKKFGPELQIKSLLGHRSQAAPEIRLISGRHVKDFTDFLASQTEMFIVEGDRVRLKHMPEPTVANAETDEDGQMLAGAKAKQAAVDYLKSVLENQEVPIPMENLYREFCNRFSHQVRQDVATNPKELLHFLKLNRNIFFIRSNKVSLVKNRPGVIIGENGEIISMGPPTSVDGDNDSTAGSLSKEDLNGPLEISVQPTVTIAKTLKQAQTAVGELYRHMTASVISGENNNESNNDSGVLSVPPGVIGVVSFDCKLVHLGQDFLALIVVGTPDAQIFIFDVAHSASILLESGLKQLLEASNIRKVIHDSKRLSAVLFQQYQILIDGVFDTQAANTVLQHQKTSRPLHEIKPISFLTLQRLYYPQSLMDSDSSPRKNIKKDPKYWSQRPLTDEMTKDAIQEAELLVPTIYLAMKCALRPGCELIFEELCQENINFFIKQTEMKNLRKERRENFSMNVIDQKLQRDPTGVSLSSRERKLLQTADVVAPVTLRPVHPETSAFSPPPPLLPPTVLPNGNVMMPPAVFQPSIPPPAAFLCAPPPQRFVPPPPPTNSLNGRSSAAQIVEEMVKQPEANGCCNCRCHADVTSPRTFPTGSVGSYSPSGLWIPPQRPLQTETAEMATQTLSTGDIVIQKLFYQELK